MFTGRLLIRSRPEPLPIFGRFPPAIPLPVPGRVTAGRVDGFNGLSIPRKSPRSPADGRPALFGKFGRFPEPGSRTFGRFADPPPRLGTLGRVDGRFALFGNWLDGKVVGSEGRAEGDAGNDGRVDGLRPPDGRLACETRPVDGSVLGRLMFGTEIFGRLGAAGRPAPRFGTLGRTAGRDIPPPPDKLPPARPPPRKPLAETSTGELNRTTAMARALTVIVLIVEGLSGLVFLRR